MSSGSRKKKVAVVYHFFPQYRKAIIRCLAGSNKYDFAFYGDVRDPKNSGIEPVDMDQISGFHRTRTRYLGNKIMVQDDLLSLAVRKDIYAIIFLGSFLYPTTWVSASIARLLGKRVLFWTHGWIKRDSGFRKLARIAFYRIADSLLLYGNRAKRIGVENGFRPDRMYVVYNSLDYDIQKKIRDRIDQHEINETKIRLFGDASLPMLICVSRLIKVRRLDLLLEGMRLLSAKGKKINLLLVGDGPEKVNLEETTKKYNLPVKYYGSCYREEELAPMIMSANLTVAPGKVGLTAMHSLAYGTPVVTHNDPDDQMPEWESIQEGKTGYFFKKGDAADLAMVLENYGFDASQKERLKQNCIDVIERFYNPAYQKEIIEAALDGIPADT